jgi:hypothetical protein
VIANVVAKKEKNAHAKMRNVVVMKNVHADVVKIVIAMKIVHVVVKMKNKRLKSLFLC